MGTTRVYVGGLSNKAREEDVEKFFKGFGSIREVILKQGFCFVVSKNTNFIYFSEKMMFFLC